MTAFGEANDLQCTVLVGRRLGGRSGVYSPRDRPLTKDEAVRIATEAYVYGYPLVTMEMTRRVMTNAAEPKGNHAPMGQFYNARTYPDASFKDVTAPNADTLYSTAWLDLAQGAVRPEPAGRRRPLLPDADAGRAGPTCSRSRASGPPATRPRRTPSPARAGRASCPKGVTEYKSPTSMVWILGRTYCTGTPEDYKAVHALQDKYSLVPLSAYGKAYTPPKGKVDPNIDMKTPVREQVNKLDAGGLLQAPGGADEGQPAGEGRRPDGRQDGEDRHRAGQGLRHRQARPGRRPRACKAFPRPGSKRSWAIQERRAPTSTAGSSRPRPASTAPTTSSGPRSPPSASAPTGRRTRSIRPPRRTPTASRTAAPTST